MVLVINWSEAGVVAEGLGLSDVILVDHGEFFLVSERAVWDLGRRRRVVEVGVDNSGLLGVLSGEGLLGFVQVSGGEDWRGELVVSGIRGIVLWLRLRLVVGVILGLRLKSSLGILLFLQKSSPKPVRLLLVIPDLRVNILNHISSLNSVHPHHIPLCTPCSSHCSSPLACSHNGNEHDNPEENSEKGGNKIFIFEFVFILIMIAISGLVRVVVWHGLVHSSQLVVILVAIF